MIFIAKQRFRICDRWMEPGDSIDIPERSGLALVRRGKIYPAQPELPIPKPEAEIIRPAPGIQPCTPPRFIAPEDKVRGADDCVIVSCGIGENYAKDFAITKRNCDRYCSDVWRLYYSEYPEGCPPQTEQQYAFKIFAREEAVRAGFRCILWMDSSLAPIAPIDRIWETIRKEGWYAPTQYCGHRIDGTWRHWGSPEQAMLGNWCSDAALAIFGVDRQTARSIPMGLSGLVGVDMKNPLGNEIHRLHKELYEKGAFNGSHKNIPGKQIAPIAGTTKFQGHVTKDPTVHGHRHDESALAFVLYSLGLRPMNLGYLTVESEFGFIGQFVEKYGIQYKGQR